jgi:signal transduction histidine kinase
LLKRSNPRAAAHSVRPVSPLPQPFDGPGEIRARLRQYDWAQTPLGPSESWSQALRTALRLALGSRFCCAIYWGPEHLVLYNSAFCATIVGSKHPWALAQPAAEIWPEIFEVIGPKIDKCLQMGATLGADDVLFPMSRAGFIEECYISFSYAPLCNEFEQIEGVFATLIDTSTRVIGERRLWTLQNLGASARQLHSVESTVARTADILSRNVMDIPFAAIYLWDDQRTEARLSAFSNIEESTAMTPTLIRAGEPGLAELAVKSRQDGILVCKGACATEVPRAAPWQHPPADIVILKISSRGENAPEGFIIVGANPHVPLDKDYLNFLQMLADQVSGFIAEAHASQLEGARAKLLAELDEAKTTFFSNVSHELRTPLTLMVGPLEEILESDAENLSADKRAALVNMRRNGLRLLKLVNALLDLARMQADCLEARFEPTNLTTITAQLATAFEWAAKKAGICFTVECEELGEPIYVDPEMWQKIVLNLLSNAFKYTLDGEIQVSLRKIADSAQLIVADTGVGIAEQELARIFKRFYRVEGTAGRTREGAGIGLALTLELVKQHGGSITVQSTLGRGSIFTVMLPLGRTHLSDQKIGTEGGVPAERTAPDTYVDEVCEWVGDGAASDRQLVATIQPSGLASNASTIAGADRRKRVLLADDNVQMRAYLKHILEGEFEVELAADGMSALNAARRESPDLLIADVMMPQLDGFALLGELRADLTTRAIPVILLTAQAAEKSKIQGLERGADDYLVKPFRARELLARANSAIRLAEMRERAGQQKERVRIARELHDTLLQSIQGMCFLLEAGLAQLKSDGPSAGRLFQDALQAALQAVSEGRKVLSILRFAAPTDRDLAECLLGLGKELPIDPKVKFLVEVSGSRRELSPYAWTEVYRICREAVGNAARHSGANQITVQLSYRGDLELLVVDNGCGVGALFASNGRSGHFGLQGMRERSETLHGRLEVDGNPLIGTRVRLTVPAAIAYAD